jgi:hypothetical protein
MLSILPVGKESSDFVIACEAIRALLAHGELASEDRDLIAFSASDLLSQVRLDELHD